MRKMFSEPQINSMIDVKISQIPAVVIPSIDFANPITVTENQTVAVAEGKCYKAEDIIGATFNVGSGIKAFAIYATSDYSAQGLNLNFANTIGYTSNRVTKVVGQDGVEVELYSGITSSTHSVTASSTNYTQTMIIFQMNYLRVDISEINEM